MKNIIYLLFFALLSSCQNDSRPTEIYNDFYSNLVLIENGYYYTVTYNNDRKQYVTIDRNNIKIHDNVQNAIENTNKKVGVGFFISKNGRIVTHKSLIELQNKSPIIKEKIDERINDSVLKYRRSINSLKSELSRLEKDPFDLTFKKLDMINEKYHANLDSIKLIEEKINNIKKESFTIGAVNYDISVSRVSGGDFQSLSSLEFVPSDEPDIKQKYTGMFFLRPNKPTLLNDVENIYLKENASSTINEKDLVHIFTMKKENSETPKYNSVFVKDVRVENVHDSFLEINDKRVEVMPGSPIMNLQGKLIGLSDVSATGPSQRVMRIKSLYAGASNRETIVKFLEAEDERDFEKIKDFFAPNIETYYDMSNPSFYSLSKRYRYIWSFTKNSTNNILKINKIDSLNFNLTTEFSYFNIRNQKHLSTVSKIRFTFDRNGKITKIHKI